MTSFAPGSIIQQSSIPDMQSVQPTGRLVYRFGHIHMHELRHLLQPALLET